MTTGSSSSQAQRPARALLARIACAVLIVEALAALGLLVVGVLSSGYALSPRVIAVTLTVGAVVGIGLGCWSGRRAAAAQEGHAGSDVPSHAGGPLTRVFGFACGAVAAVAVAIIVMMIASTMRGPVIGVWELGTPRYARDQRIVDQCAALAVVVIGLVGGGLLMRSRPRRAGAAAFAAGLIAGAVLLGLGIVCR